MRRFPSGTTDQYIYFVAVDSSDLITRETGLTTFTVYRARNGATAAAYTTPTVAEVSSANMPGVYSLLLDEDMTIASGKKSEEVVLHITQASMAPVTLVYELYRPDVTAGETITVSSGAVSTVTTTTTATNVTTVNGLAAGVITAASIAADAITDAKVASDVTIASVTGAVGSVTGAVGSVASGGITAASFAADAITAAKIAADVGTEIGTAVWATATRSLTVLDEDSTTLDLDATIRSAVGLASANLDTQIGTLATAANLTTVAGYLDTEVAAILAAVDTEVAAIKAKTDALPTDPADASDIAASCATVNVTPATLAGYIDTEVASILAAVDTEVAAIKAKTDNLPADPADASDIAARFTTLDTAVADLPTNAELATALGTADDAVLAQVALVKAKTDLIPAAPAAVGDIPSADITKIKAKTDSLTFTVSGQVDANIQYVNDVQVNGTGAPGSEWGP